MLVMSSHGWWVWTSKYIHVIISSKWINKIRKNIDLSSQLAINARYLGSLFSKYHYLQEGLEEKLVSRIESLTTASSLSFLCQVQCAWDALNNSNVPYPKLPSLNIDIVGTNRINYKNLISCIIARNDGKT